MKWILQNWVWVLLGAGFISMHLFGHGSHGGHGGHSDHNNVANDPEPRGKDNIRSDSDKGSGHHH
jgi:hypothetical protein